MNLHLENYEAAVADFKSALELAGIDGNAADERSLQSELRKAEVDLKRSKTKDYYKILGMKHMINHEILSLSDSIISKGSIKITVQSMTSRKRIARRA